MRYLLSTGILSNIPIEAEDAHKAVDVFVRGCVKTTGYCLLGTAICVAKRGDSTFNHVWFSPPYEEHFPDLFDGSMDVQVVPVEKT